MQQRWYYHKQDKDKNDKDSPLYDGKMEKLNRREFVRLCGGVILAGVGIGISGCIQNNNKNTNETAWPTVTAEPTSTKKVQKERQNNSGNNISFILVGDPHVKTGSPQNRGNERLAQIVDFLNKQDVDFVVFLGDMADDGKNKTYDIVKKILNNLNKNYYAVAGNHDILVDQGTSYESYYGPMEHIENINGYQLLFAGIWSEPNPGDPKHGNVKLNWSFDFNKAGKGLPTLVFLHGPTTEPPLDCPDCKWEQFFGYAKTMQPELDKFSNLKGVFSGHVHYDSDQTINNVRHITVNGLIQIEAGGILADPSDYIGLVYC
jgi:calcineurin-like phosphoesterase family protein